MSDPGDIPLPAAGRPNLVEALSIARDLPVDALLLAADAPDRIAPAVLRVVERAAAGEALADRDANLLFWGIHVLAEVRDVRLCGPLLRLLRRPDEELEAVLSDALTETVARIVVGVFDGEVPPLREALLDPATPGMARWQLFLALAYLASTGRVGRDEAHAILLAFDVDRPGGSSDDGWYGWEDAIALCGFADLAPRVAAARADARLLDEVGMSPEEFASTLEAAAASPDHPARFAASGVGEFGTAADELDAMLAALADDEDGADAPEPVRNPLRDLGRNDPCPCGSGKKFKRCCLAA